MWKLPKTESDKVIATSSVDLLLTRPSFFFPNQIMKFCKHNPMNHIHIELEILAPKFVAVVAAVVAAAAVGLCMKASVYMLHLSHEQ